MISITEGLVVSKRQTYRAFKKARSTIHGKEHEFVNKLRSYCIEIKMTNLGNTCLVKLSDIIYDGKKRLLRFYMR